MKWTTFYHKLPIFKEKHILEIEWNSIKKNIIFSFWNLSFTINKLNNNGLFISVLVSLLLNKKCELFYYFILQIIIIIMIIIKKKPTLFICLFYENYYFYQHLSICIWRKITIHWECVHEFDLHVLWFACFIFLHVEDITYNNCPLIVV